MATRLIGQETTAPPPTVANDWLGEKLLLGRLRRNLFARATGSVLEVACGFGLNFQYFPDGCRITAGDIDPSMLSAARATGTSLARDIDYRVLDAEHLPFPDDVFDTVVSSMAVCSFDHPVRALQEMTRVCNPNGAMLLLEHGRSSFWPWAKWQDMREDGRRSHSGCHDNREPRLLAEEAGLEILSAHRTLFGVVHALEARPAKADLQDE